MADWMTQQTIADLERSREKLRQADANHTDAQRRANAMAQIDPVLYALSRLVNDPSVQKISDELAELFADCLIYSHRPERSVDLSSAHPGRVVIANQCTYTAMHDEIADQHWILIDDGDGKERRVWTMRSQRDVAGTLESIERAQAAKEVSAAGDGNP